MENFAAFMGIIAAFIALLILMVVASAIAKRAIGDKPPDPEQHLAQRFAKGEISEGEYGRALSVLRLGPPLDLDDRDLR